MKRPPSCPARQRAAVAALAGALSPAVLDLPIPIPLLSSVQLGTADRQYQIELFPPHRRAF
jgi:hypothetical protein